ncbi:hypothetical protein ABT126_13835 [Streptomyces sp. NPDC002012]|uniref:hypothetical protein n=1 Tax=unclassified Streptomyces TaxID=2593676 RepID=UPI0033188142
MDQQPERALMHGADRVEVRRVRRWFWTLTGWPSWQWARRAAASPATGLLVGASAPLLAASSIQAARIGLVLTGPPRPVRRLLARRTPHQGRRHDQ